MNPKLKLLAAAGLGVLIIHLVSILFLSKNTERRVRVCQVQVRTIRSYIERYRQEKGIYPKNLLEDLSEVVPNWEMASRSLDDPFDSGESSPRINMAHDGTGGWYYNPEDGHIVPNYRRIRIWISPFWYRSEDPTTWSQEPLQ